VEQPTKFELVINLKAAKQLGLTIPPNVLGQGDQLTVGSDQLSVPSKKTGAKKDEQKNLCLAASSSQ
jgi:hypothetical protein